MEAIEQVWNAVTSNGMREMEYERFHQAATELIEKQRQELIKELDARASFITDTDSLEDRYYWSGLQEAIVVIRNLK